MKMNKYIILVLLALVSLVSCEGFLDRKPLTQPSSDTYLSSEDQIRSYVNGLYMALPCLTQYGTGVRSQEKDSDNIVSEKYNARINGELTSFSGEKDWAEAYSNLRSVNWFFEYYRLPESDENEVTASLRGDPEKIHCAWTL